MPDAKPSATPLSVEDLIRDSLKMPPMTAEDLERRRQSAATDQGFVEDSARAFKFLVAFRDALIKSLSERKLTDAERTAADSVIKGLDQLVEIKNQTISAYAQMVKLQQDFIVFQNEFYTKIIKTISEQMNKKRGFWSSLLHGIKKAFEFMTTLLAGIGLAAVASTPVVPDIIPGTRNELSLTKLWNS